MKALLALAALLAATPPAPLQPPPPGATVTLAQAIDTALANNPRTRAAWLDARAAEAALGSARSEYLPSIDLDAQAARQRSATATAAQTIYGATAVLDYLLYDFGGREARVDRARAAMQAAGFQRDQSVQDTILRTQQAYYGYLDAKALLASQGATLRERRASLESAEARHNAGVATIADVLQARTALSQAQLAYDSIEGSVRAFQGALATAMGVSPVMRYEVGELPAELPLDSVRDAVEQRIARAATKRPELGAARAVAEASRARVREVRAEGLPSFNFTSSFGETSVGGTSRRWAQPYAAGVAMRFPLFTGFRNSFDIRAAEARAAAAEADLLDVQQQIDLQVWTSYYAVQTAAQRVKTSRDLLASAQQSAEVAASRYKAGVGSILDLLTAEAALEVARAQEVQARTDWLMALAQLAHDTGTLGEEETGSQ
jgi:TolC family type I secretion outer membrane protein